MFVQVSQLPVTLQKALKSANFTGKDIEVKTAESVNISQGGYQGKQAFASIVNLSTGQFVTTKGSWGGPNMFNPGNIVDNHDKREALEPNVCAITGYIGWIAEIHMHPFNINTLIAAPTVELTQNEKQVLYGYCRYSAQGKKHMFERLNWSDAKKTEVLKALESKGMVKLNKAGAASVTTEGKNVAQSLKSVEFDRF